MIVFIKYNLLLYLLVKTASRNVSQLNEVTSVWFNLELTWLRSKFLKMLPVRRAKCLDTFIHHGMFLYYNDSTESILLHFY